MCDHVNIVALFSQIENRGVFGGYTDLRMEQWAGEKYAGVFSSRADSWYVVHSRNISISAFVEEVGIAIWLSGLKETLPGAVHCP